MSPFILVKGAQSVCYSTKLKAAYDKMKCLEKYCYGRRRTKLVPRTRWALFLGHLYNKKAPTRRGFLLH